MKKLLLSVYLLSIAALFGYSQSLSLSDINGTAIAPNAFINQHVALDSGTFYTYLKVTNTSNARVDVLCKKVQLSLLDSTQVTMCWAGSCYGAETFVSPYAQTLNAGETNSEFSGDYGATTATYFFKTGESVVRWVFFDRANVNDSVCVTFKYTTFPLGIAETNARQGKLSNVFPNPAASEASCNYSVPASSQGTILIRDILGSTLQTQLLSAASGRATINTMNLSNGIYFCSLLVDGKVSQTKKLIVKH